MDVQVERAVPKFLQPYAHLLERGKKKRPRPALDADDGADDEAAGDDDIGDAVRSLPLPLARHGSAEHTSSELVVHSGATVAPRAPRSSCCCCVQREDVSAGKATHTSSARVLDSGAIAAPGAPLCL